MVSKLFKRIIKNIRGAVDIIENPLLFKIKFLRLDMHFAKDCLEVKNLLGKDPETVFDIGANSGRYTATAAYIFPRAKIYSFEPLRECYEEILKFQEKFKNIIAVNSAISEIDGKISFYKNDFSPASSYKKTLDRNKDEFPWTDKEVIIEVNSQKMDSFLKNKQIAGPIFMKIDVQGSELDVLKSASQCLKSVDVVMLEVSVANLYEGMSTFDDVYQYLKKNGFKFVDICDKEFSLVDKKILFFDAIFIKDYL